MVPFAKGGLGRLLPLAGLAGIGLLAGCTTYVQPAGITYVPIGCPAGVVNGQVLPPAPPPAPVGSSSTTTTQNGAAGSSSSTTTTTTVPPQVGDAPIIANAPPNTCYAIAPAADPAYSGWPYRYGYYAGYGAYPAYPYYADPYPYPGVWIGGAWHWHHRR